MKRFLAMMLVAAMMLSLVACGKDASKGAADVTPLDALTKVWETYGEDEMFFAMGGDMNNIVDNAPGAYDVADVEGLDAVLGFPQASVALIDEAASLVHAMNANTFTAGAYHVTDDSEVEMLIEDLKDNIMNRQWMCGFPDTLIIVKVGGSTLVSAFGNAEIIETFKTKLLEVHEGAEVVCEESLV